ncbi:MAG TPA: 50S ribosomal protein L4 [Nitrospiria bacterium]|jgi:large subunit ribosomal protein L4|nr:50S ribosomal protein L4 [Nitrospiria bacterium]
MPDTDVVDLNKKIVGKIQLDERIFKASPDLSLVHEAVVMQLASQRQGTASTKTRGEVSGGGKKPWKQKGTGRARAGSIRSPLWKGGGTIFGPRPRDYGYSIPKKKYRTALRAVLSARFKEGAITVVDRLEIEGPKTKMLVQALGRLGLNKKVAILMDQANQNIERAARNLPGVKVLLIEKLNVYDLLDARQLLIAQPAVSRLVEVWS